MEPEARQVEVLTGSPTQHESSTATNKRKSDGRADFMKRFFSVAVSVGFASKIGDLSFLSSLSIPTPEQIHQLILLVFAMAIVVGSWEFYFGSIERRPLVDMPRFIVDIIIVSLYIILLLSVKSFDVFFLYLIIILLFYIIWDILSMRVYPEQYGIREFSALGVFEVYKNGAIDFSGNGAVGKTGPFITAWWFIVFCGLFAFHLHFVSMFYSIAVASSSSYIFYRSDQARHWSLYCRIAGSALVFVFLFAMKAIH